MGRFPGETSCLTLVWAVLDLLITHQTNGIHFTALDRQRLKRARYEDDNHTIPDEVTALAAGENPRTHHDPKPHLAVGASSALLSLSNEHPRPITPPKSSRTDRPQGGDSPRLTA